MKKIIIAILIMSCKVRTNYDVPYTGIPSPASQLSCARVGDVTYSRVYACVAGGASYTCIEHRVRGDGCGAWETDRFDCAPGLPVPTVQQ